MKNPLRSHLCDSHQEEVASIVTHAIGIAVAIASLVAMILVAAGDPRKVVSAAIFGTSLILLYTSSTLYHSFSSPRWKSRFQTFDHICIYLLIAGSYTPITLITLKGAWGWSLFGTVWGIALGGILLKTLWKGRKDNWFSTALYILMGWIVVIAMGPLIREMPTGGLIWLVAGGLAYTLGVIFYVWDRLPFNHAIWHLFVLGGSLCHVVSTSIYILR